MPPHNSHITFEFLSFLGLISNYSCTEILILVRMLTMSVFQHSFITIFLYIIAQIIFPQKGRNSNVRFAVTMWSHSLYTDNKNKSLNLYISRSLKKILSYKTVLSYQHFL